MLSRQSPQKSFYDVDQVCPEVVPKESFYHALNVLGPAIISDDDFAEMYCEDNGAPSIPPALLAKTLLLQRHDNVSDRQAAENVRLHIGWKHALGVPLNYQGFNYSNLSRFRARLLVHDLEHLPFEALNRLAQELGLIDEKHLHAVDSSGILGAAQVQDTYKLISCAIADVVEAVEAAGYEELRSALKKLGLTDYTRREKADIYWKDSKQRREHLKELVGDARKLLSELDCTPAAGNEKIQKAAALLIEILAQDITEGDDGPKIKRGVAKDRIISTEDPEMRHGRKSQSQRFDGYKAHITEDVDSEWVTNTEVDYANKRDSENALAVVTEQEESAGYVPEMVLADNGYATSDTRAEFREAGIELYSPVHIDTSKGQYNKYDFTIDLEQENVSCPAGKTTSHWHQSRDPHGRKIKVFKFGQLCQGCSHRERCTTSKNGRTVSLLYHEIEVLRALERQQEKDFYDIYNQRAKCERKISEIMFRHGMRQARYFGRRKVAMQLSWTAAVVNLKRLLKLLLQRVKYAVNGLKGNENGTMSAGLVSIKVA